ncbi:MAG TPA: hypothetical protein PL032_12780, partial [Syntrophorhabdus sp.]|nr:hypothetical protein [Syntrophorhabdus sp.]
KESVESMVFIRQSRPSYHPPPSVPDQNNYAIRFGNRSDNVTSWNTFYRFFRPHRRKSMDLA